MGFSESSTNSVDIELRSGNRKQVVTIFPSDLCTRRAFFAACEEIKNYGGNLDDPAAFNRFLDEKIDNIYGGNVADFITGGQCRPDELIRFLCETARFFIAQSERLIAEYTADTENEVMV